MALSLALGTDERATLAVGLLYSDGSVTPLATSFRYVFEPSGIADITAGDNILYVNGRTPGVTTLTLNDMDWVWTETVVVTVTGDVPPPPDPPAAPFVVGLSVTLGTPEPRP